MNVETFLDWVIALVVFFYITCGISAAYGWWKLNHIEWDDEEDEA